MNVIAGVSDIVVACSAATGAIVALKGLNAWRDELKGRVDFDVARRLLRATYKLREELAFARSPLVHLPSPDTGGDMPSEAERWELALVERLRPLFAAVTEFEAEALEAEVLWGTKVKTEAIELRNSAMELRAAVVSYFEDKRANGKHFEQSRDFGVQVRSTVFSSPTEDKFAEQVSVRVTGIEQLVIPHLGRK